MNFIKVQKQIQRSSEGTSKIRWKIFKEVQYELQISSNGTLTHFKNIRRHFLIQMMKKPRRLNITIIKTKKKNFTEDQEELKTNLKVS